MREEVPADKLAERLQWRNNRLVELAVLKQKQNKRDAEGKEAKTE